MTIPSALQGLRVAGILTLAFALSCARNPVTNKRQMSLMSTKQEIALGASADPQIQAEYGVYPDESLQKYISEKGKAMAAISHRPNLPWGFKLVDSPVVNAFAVPGGQVYFTRGIMAHFNNEAQFAGVLGHEIGHVTARHGAEQYTKGMLAQLGLIVGMIASPQFAQFGDVASQGVQLLMLKNGRNDESQSDKLGVEYSSKIGYDARHMADFFQTLKRVSDKASGGRDLPTFLSTHPDPEDRYNKVKLDAERWKREHKNKALAENRNEYLRRIEGMVYGEDPNQGFVEANTFYHPELKFQFPVPQGWKTQNMPTQFQMASADGNALMVLTLSGQKSLQAAAQEDAKNYSLRALDAQNTTINGMPALIVVSEQVQQQQQGAAQGQQMQRNQMERDTIRKPTRPNKAPTQGGNTNPTQQPSQGQGRTQNQPSQGQAQATGIRVLSAYIQYNGLIYVLRGVSEAANYTRYEPTFVQTIKGFNSLTDPDKLNRKPERIQIKTIAREQTLADALRETGMAQSRFEELAILNGMQQTDRLPAGMLIKVVGK